MEDRTLEYMMKVAEVKACLLEKLGVRKIHVRGDTIETRENLTFAELVLGWHYRDQYS